MTTIFSIISFKGGTGKTTTTVNLASAMGLKGRFRVAVIDTDPQANATKASGFPRNSGFKRTLVDSIISGDCPPVYPSMNGYQLVPSDIRMATIDNSIGPDRDMTAVLKQQIEKLSPYFDFILIDCTPTMHSPVNDAVLAIADHIIIPMEAEYFAFDGLNNLMSIVPDTSKVLGIVITKSKNRVIHHEIMRSINQSFPGKCFNTTIRDCIRLPESQDAGRSVFNYAEQSNAGVDYYNFFLEVLARLSK